MLVVAVIMSGATEVYAKKSMTGKDVFNYVDFGGGNSGKSCNTCHPGGKGLHGVATKTMWKTPNGHYTSLEEAVNNCQGRILGTLFLIVISS